MDQVKSLSQLLNFLGNENVINYLSKNYVYDYSKIFNTQGEEGNIQNHLHYPDKICFSCYWKKWSIRKATVVNDMIASMKQFLFKMFCCTLDYSN